MKTVEERLQALEREAETMLGMIAGYQVVLSALIRKHPNPDQLKLDLATLAEVADAGALGQALSEKQRRVAREVVEQLQRLKPAPDTPPNWPLRKG